MARYIGNPYPIMFQLNGMKALLFLGLFLIGVVIVDGVINRGQEASR